MFMVIFTGLETVHGRGARRSASRAGASAHIDTASGMINQQVGEATVRKHQSRETIPTGWDNKRYTENTLYDTAYSKLKERHNCMATEVEKAVTLGGQHWEGQEGASGKTFCALRICSLLGTSLSLTLTTSTYAYVTF